MVKKVHIALFYSLKFVSMDYNVFFPTFVIMIRAIKYSFFFKKNYDVFNPDIPVILILFVSFSGPPITKEGT